MTIIEADQLTYTYPRTSQAVLQDLSFQIPAGCVTTLLGCRGAGKSTLCLALAGIVPGFYGGEWLGRLRIGDVEVNAEDARSSDVVQQVAIALQAPDTQIIGFRVEETIAFGLENQGIPPGQIRERIQYALEELGISHLQHRFADQLSGGQKQACVLAAMLALDTPIIVLDESTAALDPAGKKLVSQVVERLKQVGKTLIISDHDLNWFQHLVDHTLVLSRTGSLLFSGELQAFLSNRNLLQQAGIPVPTLTTLSQALQDFSYDVPIWMHFSEAQTWISKYLAAPAKNATPTLGAIAPVTDCASIPTVDCTHLTFLYPGATTPALSDVSFTAYPGRVLGIIGQNGSGKSTAIRHLNGLLRPRRGTVMISGESIRKTSVAQMAYQVGVVFQNPDLMLFNETVEQEALFSVMLAKDEAWKQQRRAEVEALMQQLDLDDHRQQSPLALSMGEKQMLAILCALALDPDVLVLDEPTSGLDQSGQEQLGNVIQQLKQQNKTILCISHDLPLLIEQADEILAFQNGQVVCCLPTGQILQNSTLFDQLGIPLPDYVQLANEFLHYPCNTPFELAEGLHGLIGAGSHV